MNGGGAVAKRGFVYQDWAAAHRFLLDNVDKIRIESLDDFSYRLYDNDYEELHIFQAKTSNSGGMKWGFFKENIFPNFYNIAETENTDENRLMFHISANYRPDGHFLRFLNDVDRLRERRISYSKFEDMQGKRLGVLERKIEREEGVEYEEEIITSILSGLVYDFKVLDQLEKEVVDFIRRCQTPSVDTVVDTILNKFHEKPSGTIFRRDIERSAGIYLEPPNQTTKSRNTNADELRSKAKSIYQRRNSNTYNISQSKKDETVIEDYAAYLSETDADSIEVETAESTARSAVSDEEEIVRNLQQVNQQAIIGLRELFDVDSEIDWDGGNTSD